MDINLLPIVPFAFEQDISRILSLRAAAESVDQEGMEISEQALLAQVRLPGHDPLKDRWIINSPNDASMLVASALVRLAPGSGCAEANILVHPDWRHLGVGSLLLSRVMERARQLDAGVLQIYANPKHPAATAFLARHGLTPQGSYTELRLAPETRLPPVIWPFGYEMRPYSQVQDLSALTQVMNLGYIPLWGHQEVSESQMASWLPEFDPEGVFMVFSEKGRPVGISRAEASPERSNRNNTPTGFIDAPGVVPQHRRLDLYRALVLTGIQYLREHAHPLVEMESWGDKLEVLKMYRELGFTDLRQLTCYEIQLSDAGRAGQSSS